MLPERNGLKDLDTRYRHRFIDLIVNDEPHPFFQRKNDVDILYTAEITKHQAILLDSSYELKIPTLENDYVTLEINERVKSFTQKKLPGRGLPFLEQPHSRGNLLVQFTIKEMSMSLENNSKEISSLKNEVSELKSSRNLDVVQFLKEHFIEFLLIVAISGMLLKDMLNK